MENRCPGCGTALPGGVPAWARQLTVADTTPLLDAAQTLQTTKFGGLPVLRDGTLAGILTANDLVGQLVGLLTHGG